MREMSGLLRQTLITFDKAGRATSRTSSKLLIRDFPAGPSVSFPSVNWCLIFRYSVLSQFNSLSFALSFPIEERGGGFRRRFGWARHVGDNIGVGVVGVETHLVVPEHVPHRAHLLTAVLLELTPHRPVVRLVHSSSVDNILLRWGQLSLMP